MKPSFDVIIYGDFGKKNTSQAENMEVIIRLLRERGQLGRVIRRGGEARYDSVAAVPFGSLIPKAFTALERLTGYNFRNFSQNTLFDFFAARKIRSKYVIASVAGLIRCVTKVRHKGGVYIEMVLMEDARVFTRKILEEAERLSVVPDLQKIKYLEKAATSTQLASYLIVISEHIRETLLLEGLVDGNGRKIFTCPLGIDTARFRPRGRPISSRFRVLYIAHFQLLKGLQYLLPAWEEAGMTDGELVIGGTLDSDARQIAQKYSHVQNVIYLGNVSDTAREYARASVFVSPSLSEGASKVVLEAMASGLPVVLTKESGIAAEDGEEALYVPARDSEAIAQQLRFLHKHPEERRLLGERARALVERKHSPRAYRENFNDILDHILTEEDQNQINS